MTGTYALAECGAIKTVGSRRLLINAIAGQVKSDQIQLSGNATNQVLGLAGTRISLAVAASRGTSQRNSRVAAIAPANWAATNRGTSKGRIPANVSESERAIVTAGFANEVEEVNQ